MTIGNTLSTAGFLAFIVSALVTVFFWFEWMFGLMGWVGLLVGVVTGPAASLFPLIEWLVEGRPDSLHFAVWLIGLTGMGGSMLWVYKGGSQVE